MDFGALPPEVNSGGCVGVGSRCCTAAAWDRSSRGVGVSCDGYASVAGSRRRELGAASLSMVAAAAPYVAWLSKPQQTEAQARCEPRRPWRRFL